MKRSTPWFKFRDNSGKPWTVYLTTRLCCRHLQADKDGGPYVGRCVHATRQVFVDCRQPAAHVVETTLHELIHASLNGVPMPGALEEAIVALIADRLWRVMASAKMRLPPLPPIPKRKKAA